MSEKKTSGFTSRLKKRLTNHLKFILFDEAMFHEVFSLRLRPLNLVILLAVSAIFLVGGTTLLIRYTSLKTYVITDDVPALRRQTALLLSEVDALEKKLNDNEVYIGALRQAISGEIPVEKVKDSVYVDSMSKNARRHLKASAEDSVFRASVEKRQMESLQAAGASSRGILSLSSPIRGAVISAAYNKSEDHLWTGLSAKPNTPIFAVYSGTIIYKDWTPSSGNVLIIEHNENLTSIYKNVGLVPKQVGDRVSQGELIATTGLGANASSDPVVHFELWINGRSVDPEDYINFGM